MWRVFVPKTDVVTGGWSNLCMNRCINCNIYQMLINVWNQGRQTSYSVGIGDKSQEMKRPGREAQFSAEFNCPICISGVRSTTLLFHHNSKNTNLLLSADISLLNSKYI